MIDFFSSVKLVGRIVNVYYNERSVTLRVMYNDHFGRRNFVSALCFDQIIEEVSGNNIGINDIVEIDGELSSYEKVADGKKMTLHNVTVKKVKKMEENIVVDEPQEIPF